MTLTDAALSQLTDVRATAPRRVAEALASRRRRDAPAADGRLMLVAADHPARSMLAAGGKPLAMADRHGLLRRIAVALEQPGVDGLLGSADIIEDLALLGVLDGKVVIGTTNRGGLQGARWELDDRMTAYDAEHLAAARLDGGKMLLRLDNSDPAVARTVEACSRTVTELADRGLMAMVEPLPYRLEPDGRAVLDRDDERLLRAVAVASGLGATSAYTWLKIPAWADVRSAARISTCPVVILGGDPGPDLDAALATWATALAEPTVRGLVVGRALLYPAGGDVAAAVRRAAALVRPPATADNGPGVPA